MNCWKSDLHWNETSNEEFADISRLILYKNPIK